MGFHPYLNFGGNCREAFTRYQVADVAEAWRVFAALADGGNVTIPLGKTSRTPQLGLCVDRFGIPWMVNAEAPA